MQKLKLPHQNSIYMEDEFGKEDNGCKLSRKPIQRSTQNLDAQYPPIIKEK